MLEGILDLVKDQALGAITNHEGIPADQKDAAIEATTSSIVDGLKEHFTSDNLSSILGLFGGGGSSSGDSPLMGSIQSSVVSALSQKLGVNPDVANSIASSAIPAVMGLLSKKSDDPNDSFNFESLVESFTGGGDNKGGGGILGALGSLFGK